MAILSAMDQIIHHPQEIMRDDAQFSALLTPHRSLSQKGFIVLMCAISLVSFTAGLIFYQMGAWPIPGFFGLDVLLIYVAFKLNYRSGRAFEAVNLVDHQLIFTQVDPKGRAREVTFNPQWAHLRVDERPGERVELFIASHGRELSFGSCLTTDEKRDFAKALRSALTTYRSGIPAQPF